MNNCLCEFLSTVWCHLLRRGAYRSGNSRSSSMELVLDDLTAMQIHIEVLDRRCVSEARRHHACGSKTLFRAKMLEHRRLQAQLLQVQRYRENVLAQIDALSNQAINQTYVQAIKGVAGTQKGFTVKEVETTMEDLQETMQSANELTDFLGQPITGQEVTDDDLEQEFLETVPPECPVVVPPPAGPAVVEAPVPVTPLRLAVPLS